MVSKMLPHLIRSIILKDDVDASEKFVAECAHGNTIGLTFLELLIEKNIQVWIPATCSVAGHPQSFPQIWRTQFRHMALCTFEFSRRKNSRVNTSIGYQAFRCGETMDISNFGKNGGCRHGPYSLDGSEMLRYTTKQLSYGSFCGFDLRFQKLHLSYQAAEFNCGGISEIGQTQRSSGCLLDPLRALQSQPPPRSLCDYPSNLSQIKCSKLFGSGSPLEQLFRSGDEYVGEESFIFGEDFIQHSENPAFSIAHLVNEFHAETCQVSQWLDIRARDIAWTDPADTQQVGDNPGIASIIFDFTNSGTAISVGLERIDHHHLETLLQKMMVDGKPVMARSLESDDAWFGLPAKQVHQGGYTLSGMLEPEELAYLMAFCVHQTDLMGVFTDIDTNGNHEAPPMTDLCGGAVPNSLRAYSLVRHAWLIHNLLICNLSQERGSILSVEALPSRRLSAAPASHVINSTPRSMGVFGTKYYTRR